MKVAAYFVCFFLFVSSLSLAQTMSKKDTISYGMGLVMADELKKSGINDIDMKLLVKAIEDYMTGRPTSIAVADAKIIVNAFKIESLKRGGEEFLANNKKKAGVMVTPSGLQYEVLTSGAGGPKPTLSNKVTTHYHGTLIDGTIFDSSVQRGEPITFPCNGVIRGWQEGLQLMSVGDKFRFYIPQDLAYGARGAGGAIPAYAALIFDVELLAIE